MSFKITLQSSPLLYVIIIMYNVYLELITCILMVPITNLNKILILVLKIVTNTKSTFLLMFSTLDSIQVIFIYEKYTPYMKKDLFILQF